MIIRSICLACNEWLKICWDQEGDILLIRSVSHQRTLSSCRETTSLFADKQALLYNKRFFLIKEGILIIHKEVLINKGRTLFIKQ
ncbi:MAG: hypothetical protein D3911_14540 [Candidatus Electrothrix sp. AW3_4]|nr:hypothetical protein [Candidatus Electrothrix gigas]